MIGSRTTREVNLPRPRNRISYDKAERAEVRGLLTDER